MPKPGSGVSPRRILVVDDEPFVCDAVKMMLEFDGHIVDTAGDGKVALEKFSKGKFDLVITDWKMPAIIGKIIDACGRGWSNVQSNHRCAEQTLQVMRDEAVAATDVEHLGARRKHARHFERHVVRSSNFSSSSHSVEATLDRCG